MSDINRCKNKSSNIHISKYVLMFIKQAAYLDIYSASFEVIKYYGKWQDLILKRDQIDVYSMGGCCQTDNSLKILLSVTSRYQYHLRQTWYIPMLRDCVTSSVVDINKYIKPYAVLV